MTTYDTSTSRTYNRRARDLPREPSNLPGHRAFVPPTKGIRAQTPGPAPGYTSAKPIWQYTELFFVSHIYPRSGDDGDCIVVARPTTRFFGDGENCGVTPGAITRRTSLDAGSSSTKNACSSPGKRKEIRNKTSQTRGEGRARNGRSKQTGTSCSRRARHDREEASMKFHEIP